MDLEEWGVGVLMIHVAYYREQVAACFEHGTVPSGSREVLNVSTTWTATSMRDFRLSPRCKCDLRTFGMLRTVS